MSEEQDTQTPKYLLVSDSNEISTQLDSKKMSYDDLAYMAQYYMLNEKIGVLSNYLTKNRFNLTKDQMDDALQAQQYQFNQVKDCQVTKLRAVEGQVILIESTKVPQSMSPVEYVLNSWYIPPELTVKQIQGCMLRGVTKINNTTIQGEEKISLISENMPKHSHQSSITTGSGIETLGIGTSNGLGSSNGIQYDMFYNDSFSTGLSRNENDGSFDCFQVQNTGNLETVQHNNMPNYHQFYAFEVVKIGA